LPKSIINSTPKDFSVWVSVLYSSKTIWIQL
jgi:hypothetical protein